MAAHGSGWTNGPGVLLTRHWTLETSGLWRVIVGLLLAIFVLLQAHMQARYVILRVLLEAGGVVTIKEKTGADEKPDLEVCLQRDKILTVGRPAIGEFLNKLQVNSRTLVILECQCVLCLPYRYTNLLLMSLRGPHSIRNTPLSPTRN